VGEWIVFIDADVAVHSDTLSRFAAVGAEDSGVVAIVGSYDETPPAPDFLSQYRNLMHRHTHLTGGGAAHSFWAGCGAVRRAAFVAAGGFDEARYHRPQIEDIELGYRLRDRGGRILVRPEIQATHLKRWTLRHSVRTDLWDRGVPWVRLLLERNILLRASTLNLKAGERSKTALVALSLLLMMDALVSGKRGLVVVATVLLIAVAVSNWRQVAWLARRRGPWFALLAAFMSVWYYLINGVSVVLAVGLHFFGRLQPTEPGPVDTRRAGVG
jgi:GT2 family glycosyltransferase